MRGKSSGKVYFIRCQIMIDSGLSVQIPHDVCSRIFHS